jgi:hypothetical protein
MSMDRHGGMISTGKYLRCQRKTVPVSLRTISRTWADPGSNPGLRGERAAASSLYNIPM